jgi:hypothetical protein
MRKILGIPMSLLVVGLLLIGGASALLVTYLSNTVEATATVQSPIRLQIGLAPNALGDGPVNLGAIFGGQSVDVYVSTENLANVSITGTMWTVISNPQGLTCEDFSSMQEQVLDFDTLAPKNALHDVFDCSPLNATSIRLQTTPTEPWEWDPLHKDIAHIQVVFKANAVGTYSVSTNVNV